MKPWLPSSILIADKTVQASMSFFGMWIRNGGKTILDRPDMELLPTENAVSFCCCF